MHLLVLERLLNRLLALDEASGARLTALEGKRLAVEVRGLGRTYALTVRDGRCRLQGGAADSADVVVSGAPLTLLNLALSDGVRALFAGQVELRGDAEVAKRFKRLFDTLDIDWEEHLSAFIGDYPARRTMRALQSLGAWCARSGRVLLRDVGDYLNEEKRVLGAPAEVADLHDAVDELRDDAARLAARVARCEHNQHGA